MVAVFEEHSVLVMATLELATEDPKRRFLMVIPLKVVAEASEPNRIQRVRVKQLRAAPSPSSVIWLFWTTIGA
jgi:hypothetical protein